MGANKDPKLMQAAIDQLESARRSREERAGANERRKEKPGSRRPMPEFGEQEGRPGIRPPKPPRDEPKIPDRPPGGRDDVRIQPFPFPGEDIVRPLPYPPRGDDQYGPGRPFPDKGTLPYIPGKPFPDRPKEPPWMDGSPRPKDPPWMDGSPRPKEPPWIDGPRPKDPPWMDGGPRPKDPPPGWGGPRPKDPPWMDAGPRPKDPPWMDGSPRPKDPPWMDGRPPKKPPVEEHPWGREDDPNYSQKKDLWHQKRRDEDRRRMEFKKELMRRRGGIDFGPARGGRIDRDVTRKQMEAGTDAPVPGGEFLNPEEGLKGREYMAFMERLLRQKQGQFDR